jgi:hypothetical protein
MEPLLFLGALGVFLIAQLVHVDREARQLERRLSQARRHLEADRAEAALAELQGDEEGISEKLQAERATLRLLALLRMRRYDEAERLLDKRPRPPLTDEAAALWADGRAQVRLGRGDAEGALAVLESIDPVPNGARAAVELTRLRILAARGSEGVWRGLRALPREVLEGLLRRHPSEPASQIALRLLAGTYR